MTEPQHIKLFEWVPSTDQREKDIPECDWLRITILHRKPNAQEFTQKIVQLNQDDVRQLLGVIYQRMKP